MQIIVELNPSQDTLEKLGTTEWSIWKKEAAVTVTPAGGKPVMVKARGLVTFPQGMSCFWEISSPIRKHYLFK